MTVEFITTSIADDVLAVLAGLRARASTVELDGRDVTVHLEISCATTSDAVYLLLTDVADALEDIEGIGVVRVVLDGHAVHDESRAEFLTNAHQAAMRRVLAGTVVTHPLLRDLPESPEKSALLRRRYALGLSNCPNSPVVPACTRGNTPWQRS